MRVAYCRSRDDDWPAAGGPPEGWAVSRFADCAAMEECLRAENPDAALVRLPGTDAELREMLSRARVASAATPVIVVAPPGREEDAAAAVAGGAADYWLEGWSALRLRTSLEQAVFRRRSGAAALARDEALERVDDAVIVTDADERIVYWNQAATRLYGYPYAEVVGRLLTDTLSPLWVDAETRLKAWRALAARGMWLGDTTHLRADGAPVSVALEIGSVRDGRGRRAGILMVARPSAYCELPVRGEATAPDARRFFERLLNAVADPIFVKDREHRLLLVNDAFCALLGRPREELLGRADSDLFSAEQAAEFMRVDERVFETGEGNVNEEPVTDAKGVVHFLVTKKTLARDADGRAVLVGVVRDVTEMVKTREDLASSREHLRHAQKLEAIGRLSGGIAHDFNNILTAIVGCAGILLDSLPPGHPGREEAEEIRRAGEKAAGLTGQLLAFARREQGVARVVDLRETFGAMRKMLVRLLPADIELEMPIPDRLSCARLDPSQAEQVLLNLVVNAGDAMEGGGRITVRLADSPSAGDAPARVVLSVTDEGAGMDEATRARVFEPFFTTKSSGTGLGLAMVREALERDGGSVEIESEPGRGTTFRVSWPACAGPAESVAASQGPRGRRAPRRASVLVVEDDDIVRRFSVRGLERAGYDVLTAADGAEALRISDAHEGCFDVVIVDVVLPKLSGVELAARLRGRQPTARILFVSGYRSPDDLPVGPDGKAHFLAKPFTAEALTERVGALVDAGR